MEANDRDTVKDGLLLLDKLLHERQFMLIFVHTLEAQPEFQMRERVTVASLLSIILQNSMVYHTEYVEIVILE